MKERARDAAGAKFGRLFAKCRIAAGMVAGGERVRKTHETSCWPPREGPASSGPRLRQSAGHLPVAVPPCARRAAPSRFPSRSSSALPRFHIKRPPAISAPARLRRELLWCHKKPVRSLPRITRVEHQKPQIMATPRALQLPPEHSMGKTKRNNSRNRHHRQPPIHRQQEKCSQDKHQSNNLKPPGTCQNPIRHHTKRLFFHLFLFLSHLTLFLCLLFQICPPPTPPIRVLPDGRRASPPDWGMRHPAAFPRARGARGKRQKRAGGKRPRFISLPKRQRQSAQNPKGSK